MKKIFNMQDWKKIGKNCLYPPLWFIIVLSLISTIGLVTIFGKGWETNPLASVCYVLAFYTLTVVCIFCGKILSKYYKKFDAKLHGNKYADKYLTDVVFKTEVGLYLSLVINMIYAVVNVVSGIIYQTHWFGIFAVYYGIIGIMQFLLVKYVRKNPIGINLFGELKVARACALILLTVNLVLSSAVLMMIFFDRGFQYQGYLIYVIAMYTFYIIIFASINMAKYRKYKSPVMSIDKVIKMTCALFSILFLETAMFAQFGVDTSAEYKHNMIIATGAGVSVIVVAMALYVIIQTSKEIHQLKGRRKLLGKL